MSTPSNVAPVCSDGLVKLATWNCRGKLDTKLGHLLGQNVDVAVVCEATALDSWPVAPGGRAVTGRSRRIWEDSWPQLAVLACEPWAVTPHEAADAAPP